MRFCDALWGVVVGCKPEFEVTSQILWVTSSRISFWEERIRSPQEIILLGVFWSWRDRIRSSQNEIRDDVTQRICEVTSNSGLHPTTTPQSASQNRIVDYIKCLSSKFLFLVLLDWGNFDSSVWLFSSLPSELKLNSLWLSVI